MKITKLTLHGFKRMALNNVLSFVYKPSEPVQIILGTNGSGKSSLLLELTPLPAEPGAYLPDGSKIIEITHRGSTYVLTSDFSRKQIHSFVKDDENLNQGGTATVQKDLVKKEFGLTSEIHALLTNQERFHRMGPTERRIWFTRLSDVSYDYAMTVYKRLAEKSRDYSGALKMTRKRLVAEAAKVVSEAEEERLRQDVEVTINELNLLMQETAPLERPVQAIHEERHRGYDELGRLSRKLLNMRFAAPYGTHPYGVDPRRDLERDDWGELVKPGFTSVEQLDGYIDAIRHDITAEETRLNEYVQEHDKVKETLDVLTRTGEAGMKELTDRKETLATQRLEMLSRCELELDVFPDPVNAASALESVYEVLSNVFGNIPQNEDRRFSQAALDELNKKLFHFKNTRLEESQMVERLHAEKAHAEAHKNDAGLECPNCHHKWVVGYSEVKFKELEETISGCEERLRKTDKEIAELEAEVQAIRDYGTVYGDFTRTVRSWPVLQPFWDFLITDGVVARAPRKAMAYLDIFRRDLGFEVQAKKMQDQIDELLGLIKAAEQVGDATYTETQQKVHEVALKIEDVTHKLRLLRGTLNEYTTYRRQLVEALELGSRIAQLTRHQEQLTQDLVEAIRRETLSHCVRQLQHSLAVKQESLTEALQQRARVTELEAQLQDYIVKEEAARYAARELSPHEGLIAQGLFGFIRNFTLQMNSLIRKIWSYPLQVMDCGLSSSSGAELDYKFPLMVKTKSNIAPDVKFGSEGMREIVDLAFKVTAMASLGILEGPLLLDEFGASFDKKHREAATAVIKQLMETKPFTQLFMVSHYEASYGAFTNAQFCVLDPSNVTVPFGNYNQHVEIA